MSASAGAPTFGVVVLTQGRRPDDLRRGLASLAAQEGVVLDVVVVGNGYRPVDLPDGFRALALPENLGIPAGRNAGVPLVHGDLLFFLDDDAWLPDPHALARVAARFAAEPDLGLLQPRVVDPDDPDAPRRWVPRLRVGDPERSSDVAAVWEGGVTLRREVFDATQGWPDDFFYAHEGIDLAWRVWDTGHRVLYAGDLVVHHPVINPTRHAVYYRMSGRNRVWLAKRNLPLPVGVVYVSVWLAITLLRLRSVAAARQVLGGYLEGLRAPVRGRRRMRWRTVWRMARAGRPPVI